jgi:hypothetical protein
MLKIESAEECLPQPVQVGGSDGDRGGPQPDRLGVALARQVLHLQADQRALDHGQVADVIDPRGPAGQTVVQPVPAPGGGDAVTAGLGPGVMPRLAPGAGVEDDQDVRIAAGPVPGLDQAGDQVADLSGGDGGLVIIGAQPYGVQHRRPAGAAALQRGDDRVRPAGDHLMLVPPAPVGMTEEPVGAGRSAWPQPRRHIGGQYDPATGRARQRQSGQPPPEPADLDAPVVDRVIQRAVAAPVLGRQHQPDQRLDRPFGAQKGIDELEQLITPPGQARVQILAELRQFRQRLDIRAFPLRFWDTRCRSCQHGYHGHRLSSVLLHTPKMSRWPPHVSRARGDLTDTVRYA